jgi:hypothetical protein
MPVTQRNLNKQRFLIKAIVGYVSLTAAHNVILWDYQCPVCCWWPETVWVKLIGERLEQVVIGRQWGDRRGHQEGPVNVLRG